MENPFDSHPDSGSYINLKERVFQKVQAANINDQIFLVVQNTYEQALAGENIFLSRPERKRLFSQILELVLSDMINKLDSRS